MSLEHQHKERSTKTNNSAGNIKQKLTSLEPQGDTQHLSVTDKAVRKA